MFPSFQKKDCRLFEVLLLERYGIFIEAYSRKVIHRLSAWFQADILKPDAEWEAMRTTCKADSKIYLDKILGEW